MGPPMRNRFDQFAKGVLRDLLRPTGFVATEHEVSGDPQKIDVWYVPDPAHEADRSELGLLGRIASAPSLFEPYHDTPSPDEITGCAQKQLHFLHDLDLRAERGAVAAAGPASRPVMWILSSGNPRQGLRAGATRRRRRGARASTRARPRCGRS